MNERDKIGYMTKDQRRYKACLKGEGLLVWKNMNKTMNKEGVSLNLTNYE